ncbi:MAG: LD-carboxypeptidase [Mycobacteriales bacterium]
MTLLRAATLRPGDRVAVVAPGGPLQRQPLEPGLDVLTSWGLEPVLGASVRTRHGYLAGNDDERLSDLQRAFDDPSVRGVFCARGGYGTGRIVDRLDLSAIRRDPKVVVGYSDVTALHLLLRKELGLVTFHGPVLARDWEEDGWSAEALSRAVMDPAPLGVLPHPAAYPAVDTLVPGVVSGLLVGGNLTLLAGSLGTSTAIDARDAILVIEDVHEAPYAFDHLLTQLRRAGVLESATGIVVGECVRCDPGPDDPPSPSVRDVCAEMFAELGIPSVYGVACGHGLAQLTLPLGVRATLDAAGGTLEVTEPATVG